MWSGSTANLLGCTVLGSHGGQNGGGLLCGEYGRGLNGPPTQSFGTGTLHTLPGIARTMRTETPVREGIPTWAIFTGQPGDRVSVMFSPVASWSYEPEWSGTLLLQPQGVTPKLLIVGKIPANGTLFVPFLGVQPLPPGVESSVVHMQSFFTNSQGTKFLGSASTRVILDSAF